MSKKPSQEFWLRSNQGRNNWALFRYNGDGTIRVTAVESPVKAYDLAGVPPPDAARMWNRLKSLGWRGAWLREVNAARMSTFALLRLVDSICGGGGVRRQHQAKPRVYTADVVVVRITRRTRLHAPDWQLNPPERPLTDQ